MIPIETYERKTSSEGHGFGKGNKSYRTQLFVERPSRYQFTKVTLTIGLHAIVQ